MKSYLARLATLACLFSISAMAVDWRPIDPSELGQKQPRVDQAADAEAIFWDVRIEDRLQGADLSLAMAHYIRIKIYTERGKEQNATVEIPRYGKRNLSDIAARTIKPDGTIIELKKDAIFDRQLVKTKGLKLNGKTFVLPNVEVGDIIEYRYRETRDHETASHMRLYFQREMPMWAVTYHLKPLEIPYLPYAMRSMGFQCNPSFQKEPDGFYSASMSNVVAFKEEPNMPPEDQLRQWVLIYYEEDKKIEPEKYWKEIGKQDFARFKPLTKVDDLVKKTAAEVTTGAEKPADKVAALDAFCRAKIRNLGSGAFHVTAEERKSIKENRWPSDTLKQKAGWGTDISLLFVALANAAGFDARMARISDRSDIFFTPQRPLTYFINSFSVAVKLTDQWSFYDPSTPYLEPGMLRWQEEGQEGLISDPKEGFFARTQSSEPGRSTRGRRASFKLLEDGRLEGTVTYTYTGHVARSQKDRYEEMTPAQQEEDWKESLQERLSTAEMAEFEIHNIADPVKPLVVRHKVSIPGYATRTGKRILLQPAFFQRNIGPRFTGSTRKWDLYFNYSYAEDDEVTIELPDGWELDQPVAPASMKLGHVGDYTVEVRRTTNGRQVIYKRHFDWGREQKLLIPAQSYTQVKQVFDFIQEQDAYTLTLKPQVANVP